MTVLYDIETSEVLSWHQQGYWVDGKKPVLPENIVELDVSYDEEPIIESGQKRVEAWTVDLEHKTYVQNLYAANKSEQELEADRLAAVPKAINRRQVKHGMLQLLNMDPNTIDNMIAAIEDENERKIAQIYWQDSNTVEIEHPVLLGFASALGLSQRQLEDFFTEANKL